MTHWDELPEHLQSRIHGAQKQQKVQRQVKMPLCQPQNPSKAKYGAKKTVVDGITFDSKKEADYYCTLKMQQAAGEVKEFYLQVPFELQPSFKRDGKTIRAIKYIADFVVEYPHGCKEVIDTKGFRTETYKVKKKLLLYKFPYINFREI